MSLHLFQGFGVELEYMIVDRRSLRVRPIADRLLLRASRLSGATLDEDSDTDHPDELELRLPGGGEVGVGNELALHVVELKTPRPVATLLGVDGAFARAVASLNAALARDDAMLLPTGAHPTMDPLREMRLWPHSRSPIYEAFNRIFDCRGHGWANLQSAHLNLPFAGDDTPRSEFGRLHAALRAMLPILPALAASSPILDGRVTPNLDARLEVYRTNSRRVPQAAGHVIPEPAYTRRDYERTILEPIYQAFRPFDPEGVLRFEWANARGCIARFMRDAIEVRVLDVQECPLADAALLSGVVAVARALCDPSRTDLERLARLPVEPLHKILLHVIRDAEESIVDEPEYLAALGLRTPDRAGGLWRTLLEAHADLEPACDHYRGTLASLLEQGCLARRILRALDGRTAREDVHAVYRELARCLARNEPFLPARRARRRGALGSTQRP